MAPFPPQLALLCYTMVTGITLYTMLSMYPTNCS